MGIRLSEIIRYYSRADICAELIRLSQNREVVVKYKEGGFGKRPDILEFSGDITKLVRKGAVSFHASEERWRDPLRLSSSLSKKELDALRIGWDLVLDVDCDILEWSTVCARLLLEALSYHDVRCASVKFSGGTGWHIGVPYEALALSKKKAMTFPDTPHTIAEYLKEFIRPHLADQILELEKDIKYIAKKIKKRPKELFKEKEFNPYSVLEIDTILIAPRHLLRMPYSLHEGRWLVSLPINPKELEQFKIDWAKPENVGKINSSFLNPKDAQKGEASQLIVQALDWKIRKLGKEAAKTTRRIEFKGKVPKDAFPPCIKLILKGLEDGRKRSVFILTNFLKGVGWDWSDIEKELRAWNLKNQPPLKSGYVNSQLRWHARQTVRIPPPNCAIEQFYRDIGVCEPDHICKKIKNPLSYPRFRYRKQ